MTTGAPAHLANNSQWEAIVLAAGAGSRFGGGKLLAPWRGGHLLDGALNAAFAAPARSVTLVWGAAPDVAEAAMAWARARGLARRLRLVEAADHAQGLSASLRTAIRALPRDSAGAFIFLGDMPRIPEAVLAPLALAVAQGAPAAAPVFAGQRGHPVLLGAGLFPRLLGLTGDRGAGGVLDDLGEALARVESGDDGVIFDVDRREDLA